MLKTRITELFGIKHPIMLAGMAVITTPELVAAVSNAGGLGNLAISMYTPENLRSDIRKIREMTDKPFAINQILIAPTAKANMATVEAVRIFFISIVFIINASSLVINKIREVAQFVN